MLVYFCRSCQYQEDADPSEWCVYRNEVHHTSREKTVVLQVREAWSRGRLPWWGGYAPRLRVGRALGWVRRRCAAASAAAVGKLGAVATTKPGGCLHACDHSPHLLTPPPLPPPSLGGPQDVRSDPTLPRTRDVRCPACAADEAVFFTASTEEGMTLFFQCCGCGHRWRDYV